MTYVLKSQKKGWVKIMGTDKSVLQQLAQEKIKVTEADVVVRRCNIGFYFEIKYKELNTDHYNVGFGSYNIHTVINWLDTCFEFVKDEN